MIFFLASQILIAKAERLLAELEKRTLGNPTELLQVGQKHAPSEKVEPQFLHSLILFASLGGTLKTFFAFCQITTPSGSNIEDFL